MPTVTYPQLSPCAWHVAIDSPAPCMHASLYFQVEELQQWTRHADSDLYLAEALLGSPLGTGQPLSEALALAVTRLPTGEAYLTRPATSEVRTGRGSRAQGRARMAKAGVRSRQQVRCV